MTEPEPFRIVRRQGCPGVGLPETLHPVLRRVFSARGVSSEADLEYSLQRLLPASLLDGVAQGAEVLGRQVLDGGRILILADFDADGATSCALAVRALRALGADQVDYLVPNRFEYGYGLTPEIVEVAAARDPDLIVTVDNGVSSIEGVACARGHGIPVLVTDHHLPGARLPDAAAIVNPNLPGRTFPSPNLAGVGVTFYLLSAVRAWLRQSGWFGPGRPEPNLAQWLDLVALGTVADVVPLDHNNRILVHQGLQRIRAGRCCSGIQALIDVAGRRGTELIAADLGFAVGPRLNAAGRLQDMSLGIECLLSDDPSRCREFAGELDGLNRERRQIETGMKEEALAWLDALDIGKDGGLPAGLCLYQPQWHPGVIGILAARIKDRYHRPVIAFARDDQEWLKGSARSVAGLHIRDLLDRIATRRPELLQRFGGHAMAAGLSLRLSDYEDFCREFDETVSEALDGRSLCGEAMTDGLLEERYLGLELAELLRRAGPWGQGFPEPSFDGEFHVIHQRVVGERHLKLQVRPRGSDRCLEAIAFNQEALPIRAEKPLARLVYRLDVNDYRGRRSAQLVVEHLELAS